MTEIKILRSRGCEVCVKLTPSDIAEEYAVKASVVTIVHTAILGLVQVAGINLDYEDNTERIYFKLPEATHEKQSLAVSVIIDTMTCGLSDLAAEFSDFLELEVI